METKIYEINVTLSREQKDEIISAYFSRMKISLYLKNDALYGNDTLLVPEKSIDWNMFNEFVSDKETFPESFVWNGYHNRICKETFSEMYDNFFWLVPSMNDKGLKNFRLYTPPTVVERLENARKNNIVCFKFILDYSLLNTSPNSKKYSIFKNVGKIIESSKNDGKY